MMTSPDTSDVPHGEAAEEKPKLTLDVEVDKPSACQRHVTVSVAREDVDRYLKQAFDKLLPDAQVPGFRPGRAPRKLVEARFRDQVGEQVKGELLMDCLGQVTDEQEFSAISEPDFDFDAIELPEEGPLKFEFDLEVRPDFELPQWKGLELERPVHEFSDEEVDAHLRTVLARYGELQPHEGPAEAGDHVSLEITFRRDGRTLSKVREEDVPLRPVLSFRDGRLEGFDELMAGARAGDRKESRLKLSTDLDDEELAGREIDVVLEVLRVSRLQLPELDRDFLEQIGGFEDEQQLREAVRGELQRQLAYHQQRRVRQQISELLTESADWDLPPETLRKQTQRELQRAVLELQASGFSAEEIRAHENELRQNSRTATARALQEHFILERIAEEEEMDAEQVDFDREVMMIASQSGESPRRVRARLEKRGQMDTLRNQIVERKVIDLITSHAQFTDTPFDPQANQTAAVDHAITGARDEGDIPEAKHGEGAEQLREPADRS